MSRSKNIVRASFSGLALLGSLLLVDSAWAAETRTANTLQIGGGFRYGESLEDSDLNPWGTGLGLSLGYTTSSALYVGGVFDYFFGDEIDYLGTKVSGNIWQLGGEVGYDLQLAEPLLLRPKLGLGVVGANAEFCVSGVGCRDESETDLGLAPGATVMIFAGNLVLNVDLRYQMILADPETLDGLIFAFGIGF